MTHLITERICPQCGGVPRPNHYREALQFLSELGSWRLVETTGDVRASSFLFQRISVVVQRFNSIFLHDGFIDDSRPEYDAQPTIL